MDRTPARFVLAIAAVLAVSAVGLSPLVAQQIPASAEEIQPLLIGTEVPSVEVRTLDDEAVDLQKVVLGKRTILLFYRGGW